MKQYKISVHIVYYNPSREKKKITKLKKVCHSYLSLSKRTKIFVHTVNKNKDIINKRIKFIFHNLHNKHPHKLTWVCRKLMFKQRNKFDFFIYGEDDIVFNKKNFNYWLKYKDLCIRNNYNLGFLRVEKRAKDNKLISSDQVKKIKYFCNIEDKLFAKPENANYSIWIYDQNEFKKFTKTKYWNFKFKIKTISGVLLIREMAAIGWHSEIMNRYKATLIPFKNKKLNKNSFIKHISNNYANNPAGLFGTISIDKIFENNLKYFFPKNKIYKFLARLKYYGYCVLRFNLKNFKKRILSS